MTKDRITSRINLIRKVYLALLIMNVIIMTFMLLGLSQKHTAKDALVIFLYAAVLGTIYAGLRLRRRWVLNVVLIYSAYSLLNSFFMRQPAQIHSLVMSIIIYTLKVAVIFFFIYQNISDLFLYAV